MGVTSFVSPGSYWMEQDFSDYVPVLGTSIVGMVGTASWGPTVGKDPNVTTPQLITNEAELIRVFGPPTNGGVDHLGLHAARQYLRKGNQLLYARVTHTASSSDESETVAAAKAAITLYDRVSTVSDDALTVTAKYYGKRGNDVRVIIEDGTAENTLNIFIEVIADTSGQLPTAQQNWQRAESFYGLPISSSEDNYFVTVINNGNFSYTRSAYVTLTDERVDPTDLAIKPVTGTYRLGRTSTSGVSAFTAGADGTDGTDAVDEDDVVGTETLAGPTGLQAFSNPEAVDVNVIAAPGYTHETVVQGLLTLCEDTRRDALALIDPPFGLPPTAVGSNGGVVEWHNGDFDNDGTKDAGATAFDSSYGTLFWPWVQDSNPWASGEIWVPPSGVVAGAIAYNDFIAEPWYAFAGHRRGKIKVLKTEYTPTKGQRDTMYKSGNAVNPIMAFPNQGIALWGNRTLQRRPSRLDRVNVRRLLLTIEKQIATATQYLTFEPNDAKTWRQFRALTNPIMEYVQARRGVERFEIICNETTNPAAMRNNGIMQGKILLVPTGVAEIILTNFTILESGAEFSEYA